MWGLELLEWFILFSAKIRLGMHVTDVALSLHDVRDITSEIHSMDATAAECHNMSLHVIYAGVKQYNKTDCKINMHCLR